MSQVVAHFHRRRQCSISGSFMGVKRTSRKQVTVFFADLKGSMELLADRDLEEARKLLDPVIGSRAPLRGHRQPGDGRRHNGVVWRANRPRQAALALHHTLCWRRAARFAIA
jgi:hypothetical protein